MGAKGGEEFRKIDDTVRRTYDFLVDVRNSQLKYMSNLRARNKEYGFILTPDLILQYNYVHQLMRSFHAGAATDVCAEDGGITCSNLSVLKPESYEKPVRVADASDYLASRIIDLLDRPVAVGDRDLNLNARSEFNANMKSLNLLYEERYRRCHEQNERLKNELSATKQQLAVIRATGVGDDNDTKIRLMKETVTRYETRLLVARELIEELQAIRDDFVLRHRREVENLIRRIDSLNDGQFLNLLTSLAGSLDSERERVDSLVRHMRLADESVSKESGRHRSLREVDKTAARSPSVSSELESRRTEYEKRLENEVNARVRAVETLLRASLEAELGSREETLRRKYEERSAPTATDTRDEDMINTVVVTREEMRQGFNENLVDAVASRSSVVHFIVLTDDVDLAITLAKLPNVRSMIFSDNEKKNKRFSQAMNVPMFSFTNREDIVKEIRKSLGDYGI